MTRLQQLIDSIGDGINTAGALADHTGLQKQSVERYLRRPEAREVIGRKEDQSYYLLAANEEDFDTVPAHESPDLPELPDGKQLEIWKILERDFLSEAEIRQLYKEFDVEDFIDDLSLDAELVCVDRNGMKYFCDMDPGTATLAISKRYNRYFMFDSNDDYWQEV